MNICTNLNSHLESIGVTAQKIHQTPTLNICNKTRKFLKYPHYHFKVFYDAFSFESLELDQHECNLAIGLNKRIQFE